LKVEILRREADGEPVLLVKQAEGFLVSCGTTRSVAREVIKSPAFESVQIAGKGHPKGVRMAGKDYSDGRNSTPTEGAPDEGFSNGDFGRPHPERTAEIPPNKTPYPCGSQSGPISAEPTLFTAPDGIETASTAPFEYHQEEVVL